MNAVVFDCDGVLVDSEPLAAEVWSGLLADYSVQLAPNEAEGLVGLSDAATYAVFAGRGTLPAESVTLREYRARLRDAFTGRLRAFPDAAGCVAGVAAAGVAVAVASNAPAATVALALEVTGLGRYFDVVVSSSHVARPKPAPDVYLEAAARLGIDPGSCLAVEDSATGAAAAAAAGMRVVTVGRGGRLPAGFAFVDRLDAADLLLWLGR